MNSQNVLVSLPVYTKMLDLDNDKLKRIIQNHRKVFDEGNSTNVKAWNSAKNTHKINPHFQPYIDTILQEIKNIKNYDRTFCGFAGFEKTLYLRDFWAIMYDTDDYTKSHQHFPCPYVASYYVEASQNSAPIHFDGVQTLKIIPKSGMLVVWPGTLYHSVPPTDGKRTVLAMNLLVKNE